MSLSCIQFIMFNDPLANTLLLGIMASYQMTIREVQSGIVRWLYCKQLESQRDCQRCIKSWTA